VTWKKIREAFDDLYEVNPTMNNVGLLSGSVSKQLSDHFNQLTSRIRGFALGIKSSSEFTPSGAVHEDDVNSIMGLFSQFDALFGSLKDGTDASKVQKGIAVLNEISQRVNAIGQADPNLGNQFSLALKERMEKIKIADVAENMIVVQSYLSAFDQLFPQLQPADLQNINKCIGILNEASPKINMIGQNHSRKGSELASAYNVRMNIITQYGERAAKKQ